MVRFPARTAAESAESPQDNNPSLAGCSVPIQSLQRHTSPIIAILGHFHAPDPANARITSQVLLEFARIPANFYSLQPRYPSFTEQLPPMTIFQNIINREIPARIVHEDQLCMAFHDVSPQAPVHVLLIPKKPVASLAELTADDAQLCGHLLQMVPVIARQLGLSDGYRTVINTGGHGGQTVFHLHIHILGGRPLHWPPG
jgi:histidine triad (HIT) family protein